MRRDFAAWAGRIACAVAAALGSAAFAAAQDAPATPPKSSTAAPERITEGDSPWLSPSGTRLAFERTGLDLDERDERGQPVACGLLHIRDLATGAERRARRNGTVTGWSGDDLVILNDGTSIRVGGSGEEPRFAHASTEMWMPSWTRSPDGRRVAYVARGMRMEDTSPVGAAKGREHTIHVVMGDVPARALDLGEHVDMRNSSGLLAFSPDGRRLAFQLGFMHYGQLPHPRVGVFDFASDTCHVVADEAAGSWSDGSVSLSGPTAWATWDAKSTRFVFVQHFGPKKRDLVTATADGTDVRRLTADGAWKSSPCLSPEGERCAFLLEVAATVTPAAPSRGVDERQGTARTSRELRVLFLRTGEVVPVVTPGPGAPGDLQWSPDGTHLWFSCSHLVGIEQTGPQTESAIWRVAVPSAPKVGDDKPVVDVKPAEGEPVFEGLASDDEHEAEAALRKAWNDDDPKVTAAMVEMLRRWSKKDDASRVWDLLRAISARRAVAATPILLDVLAREAEHDTVSWLLLDWDVRDAVPTWRRHATSDKPYVKGWATVALARYGDDAAWERVRALLKQASRRESEGHREHRDDMPDDVRSDNDLRDAVCDALAHVRDARSVEILLPLLADEGFLFTSERVYVVGDSAAQALAALTAQKFGRDRAAWETWWTQAGKKLPERGEDR